jgi:hypothetical protein
MTGIIPGAITGCASAIFRVSWCSAFSAVAFRLILHKIRARLFPVVQSRNNAKIEIRKALVSLPFYLGLLPVAYLFISLIFVTHFREETMDVCVYLAKLGLVAWVVRQLIRVAWYRFRNRSRALVAQWHEPQM